MRAIAHPLLVIAIIATLGPAHAEESRPWYKGVSKAAQDEALDHYRRGNAHFAQQNCAAALIEYRKAVARWDHPAVRYNIAMCLLDLQEAPLRIYEQLSRALRFGAAPIGDDLADDGKKLLHSLRGKLDELTVRVNDDGVTLSLDGRALELKNRRATLLVAAGPHELVAQKKGYRVSTRRFQAKPGGSSTIRFDLVLLTESVTETRWPTWVPWSVSGLGAAVALAGVPFAIRSRDNAEQYDERVREECMSEGCAPGALSEETRDLRTRARAQDRIAIASFIAGGVTLAAGITMLVLNRPQVKESRVTFAPVLTDTTRGFLVELSF